MQFNVWNTIALVETGTAASGASGASELSIANGSREGKLIHNTGSVDLHVAVITSRDATLIAAITGTIVSGIRTFVIPAGYSLPIEAKAGTRILLAASSGTCTYNAVDLL